MRRAFASFAAVVAVAACFSMPGCSSEASDSPAKKDSGTNADAQSSGGSGGSGGSSGAAGDAAVAQDSGTDAADDAPTVPPLDTLDANQNRLLATYLAYLKQAHATTPQSNGLTGNALSNVCELWSALQPAAQAVFLTLSARLQGSILGSDGQSMLVHMTKLYRLVGGDGATASDPGSCGGSEFNRMILSMDTVLHTALIAANDHQGAKQANGKYDITDIETDNNPFWRDSHDVGGTHAPFDLSDETDRDFARSMQSSRSDSRWQ